MGSSSLQPSAPSAGLAVTDTSRGPGRAESLLQPWERELCLQISLKNWIFSSWLSQVSGKRLEIHPPVRHWREDDF